MQVVDAVGVVVLLIAVLLGLVALRRRRLLHLPGALECAVRRQARSGGGGWSLGVARLAGDRLEWHRLLSLAPRPALALSRVSAEVCSKRTALPVEHIAATAGGAVLELRAGTRTVELALSPAALTGLVAWLEAAPPGLPRSLAG
jgi:hypothetical protein